MGFVNFIKRSYQKLVDRVIRRYMKKMILVMLDHFCNDDANGLQREDVDMIRRKLFHLSSSRFSTTNSTLSEEARLLSEIENGTQLPRLSPEIRITDDYWNLFPN